MRLQTLLSVTLFALGAGSTGWKPIPPPRGVYQSKASHEPFKLHSPSDEFRIAGGLEDLSLSTALSPVASSEIFFKSPTHSYKTFSTDLSHTHTQDFDIFKKETPKPYKPVLSTASTYEEAKRAAVSSFNYNFRRKPIKTTYLDRPDVSFNEDLIKHQFLDNEIRPLGAYNLGTHEDRQCSLYKVAFRQDLYFQYIQYKVAVPDLKEFTLCMWNKYSNHTNDHPLFSYAVRNQPRALAMWVSTTDRSNYLHMSINGHPILRLNYPIRINRWYHTCSSWNGKTGEWQVWVNAERIGRGFHNLLVGHVIKGGGIAITGQEQRQLGGGFLEGADAPKGSGGLLGEVTMVQLYKVALTAGKAFNDHRTHHSTHSSTTPAPPAPPTTPGKNLQPTQTTTRGEGTQPGHPLQPTIQRLPWVSTINAPAPPKGYEVSTTPHPFLENGQLRPRIPVFELAESIRPKTPEEQQQQQQQDLTNLQLGVGGIPTSGLNLFNNPFQSPFISSLDASVLTPYMFHFQDHNLFKRGNDKSEDTRTKRNGDASEGNSGDSSSLKVKYLPTPQQVRVDKVVFPDSASRRVGTGREKRQTDTEADEEKREFVLVDEDSVEPEGESERDGRALRRPIRQNAFGVHGAPGRRRRPTVMRKQEAEATQEPDQEHDQSKRQILLGDFGFGQFLGTTDPIHQVPLQFRPAKRPKATAAPPPKEEAEDEGPVDPIEPAEGEVRRIMSVCSGCDADPFRKVAVISWRSTPKKIYSGALFLKARQECRRF